MEAINIVEYDEFRAQVDEVKNICNFIPDVSTDEGYQKSKRVSLDVGKILTAIEKCRKEKKSYALELGRSIDSEAKAIVAELEQYQLPHKEAYKALDREKKEREQKRKDELEARVREIRELPEAMRDSDSNGIKMALESLQVEQCEDFYEYTMQALEARKASQEALTKMFQDRLKHEKEQAELAQLRKEQAEREQKERDERIAREAAEKAKREAEEKAEAERRTIEQKAENERKAKEAAELKLKQQQEQAEREKQEAIERERQRVADEEAAIKAEAEAREKDRKHKAEIHDQAMDSLVAGGIDKDIAKQVVTLIAKKQVANVAINY